MDAIQTICFITDQHLIEPEQSTGIVTVASIKKREMVDYTVISIYTLASLSWHVDAIQTFCFITDQHLIETETN